MNNYLCVVFEKIFEKKYKNFQKKIKIFKIKNFQKLT